MTFQALDRDIQELIRKRAELAKIDYNNPAYDDLEEKLHDFEDKFQEQYGAKLEAILQDVHDEHCPDSDVLMPIAYLAKNYLVDASGKYAVAPSEGVFVESEKYPGKDTRLVFVPSPLRLVLNTTSKQFVVWEAK